MSKVHYTLSKRTNSDGKSEIMVRFTDGRHDCFRAKTRLYIDQKNWDAKQGMPKASSRTPNVATECRHITNRLQDLTRIIIDEWSNSTNHDAGWITRTICGIKWDDDRAEVSSNTLFSQMSIVDAFDMMVREKLKNGTMAATSIKCHNVIRKKLAAYGEINVSEFATSFQKFVDYLRNESSKSANYMRTLVNRCVTFWHWCQIKDNKLPNLIVPTIPNHTYGTPYYIGKETRNILAAAPMPSKMLDETRDVFILQCYIGCRISDLIRMTYANISNGTISYIPKKTQHTNGNTITVPIHPEAMRIIEKYRGVNGDHIIPKVWTQNIDERIKMVFAACPEADLSVTIRDKHSGEERITKLSEVASTHMARRTFVGCLYENGFRESDICSLSGHKEGSAAIQRYRKVTDAIKQSMIDSL